MTEPAFRDPQALRRSVTDHLGSLARADARLNLNDLLRQFAYDRLLCRVFSGAEADRWILKGATAMLARLGPEARHTLDVDLHRRSTQGLLRLKVAPGRPVAAATETRRVRVTVYLGATQFAVFPVDLVTNLDMTSVPEEIDPLLPVRISGMPATPYRVYPVPDHIADKVCALHEVHERTGAPAQPSTRYRDLVDLAVFARTTRVDAGALIGAVRSERRHRRLALPKRLTVPSTADWPAGYAREIRNAPAVVDRTLDAAVETVRRFIDPILEGNAAGVWDPCLCHGSKGRDGAGDDQS